MYRVKYIGCGQMEINLPSYPAGVIIKHGEYARLKLSEADKRTIKSLRKLGLFLEEEREKEFTKPEEKPVEKVEVKEATESVPVNEPVEDFMNPPEESQEVISSKEDLMKKTAAELREILKDMNEDTNGTKSEMCDRILEKTNASNN